MGERSFPSIKIPEIDRVCHNPRRPRASLLQGVGNTPFVCFGNGISEKDLDQDADKSHYITPNVNDVNNLLKARWLMDSRE